MEVEINALGEKPKNVVNGKQANSAEARSAKNLNAPEALAPNP